MVLLQTTPNSNESAYQTDKQTDYLQRSKTQYDFSNAIHYNQHDKNKQPTNRKTISRNS